MTQQETYEANLNDWVVIYRGYGEKRRVISLPMWNDEDEHYQLIAKEHSFIADAVIANPNVEVEFLMPNMTDDFKRDYSFFDTYDYENTYRLAPTEDKQDFNGGFISASHEAYDLLIELDYIASDGVAEMYSLYIVHEQSFMGSDNSKGYKQFYINNHKLSWDKPTEQGEEDDKVSSRTESLVVVSEDSSSSINDSNTDSSNNLGTISITDEQGKTYKFEKPEFECELLKIQGGFIYGVCDLVANQWFPQSWLLNGGAIYGDYPSNFNLTPIQEE